MKRVITILAMAALLLSMTACSSGNGNDTPTSGGTTTPKPEVETQQLALGETAATDIIEITLDKADLAIALENEYGNEHFLPKDYKADEDSKNPFVAAKGHTLVAITYTANNLDRSSVEFDGDFNTTFITIEYNGNTYNADTKYGMSKTNGEDWESYQSGNVLLLAGDTKTLRCYVDIPVEADSLEDEFNITFSLPNSKGSIDSFSFVVTKEGRLAVEEKERMANEEAEAERLANVEALGNEIAKYLIDKKWQSSVETNVYIVFYADGKAEYFSADGSIKPMHWEATTEKNITASFDDKKQGVFDFELQRDDIGSILSLNKYFKGNLVVKFTPE